MPAPIFVLPAGVDNLESCEAIIQWALNRADEPLDGTSDYQRGAEVGLVQKYRDLRIRHPWLCTVKYPPGLILLKAPVKGLTATVTGGSTALTLSAAPPNGVNVEDWVIMPKGADYFLRVVAHSSGASSLTVDGAPEDLNGVAVTIAKIEYDLPDGCGIIIDSIFRTHDNEPVLLKPIEVLEANFPGVPEEQWPPVCAARLTKTKLRLSSYPPTGKRLLVNFTEELDDPCAITPIPLDGHLRATLAEGLIEILYELKGDQRLPLAAGRYREGIKAGKDYEFLLRLGTGTASSQRERGAYAD